MSSVKLIRFNTPQQMSSLKALGENMKAARKAAGLSQEDVAESLKTSNVTVSRWETGAFEPNEETIQALARLYKTTPRVVRYGADAAALDAVGGVRAELEKLVGVLQGTRKAPATKRGPTAAGRDEKGGDDDAEDRSKRHA